MRTLTKLASAFALASSAATANAAAVDLGTIVLNVPTIFSGTVANGNFSGLFAFNLPVNGASGFTAVNVPMTVDFPFGGTGTFNVLLTTLSLISNPDGITTGLNGDETVIKAVNSTDLGQSSNAITFALNAAQSPSGPMFLSVIGLANGTLGGIYSGSIYAVPVPEPETWAMMLIGAGLVGFRLRNRSKKAAATRLV